MAPTTLDDTALTHAFEEADALRRTVGPRDAFTDPEFLRGLAATLKGTTWLRDQPIVEAFVDDAEHFGDKHVLEQTKRHINEGSDGQVFSLFNASYFPALSLDYVAYDELPVHDHLAATFPSRTTPVTIRRRTPGFASRPVVALFPENHIDGVQRSDDRIFYFIDKFLERHRRITQKMVGAVVAPDAFPLVRRASDEDILRAATTWVWLHEYHHRQGDMPIPQYLPAKSLKPLAGLEELRVDVSGMLVCLGDSELPPRDAALAYEFMLAERLLRYAVEGIPKPNYDAVASQLLFNYLRERGAIRLRGGAIHLDRRLPDVLADFLGDVHAIEAHIHAEPTESVKRRLLDFTDGYAHYDAELKDYRHIPYFADVKERLGV